MDPVVSTYTNKRVDFRFRGHSLQFDLSHALFSSFDVDSGTRLLLKTIAQNVDLGTIRSIADIGCGVGVIGAALKKDASDATCIMQDRDALAVRFSRANCLLNGIDSGVEFAGGLGFQELGDKKFDLVISNLPAKAGMPVLKRLLRDSLSHLNDGGIVAVVVVMPLADEIKTILEELDTDVLHVDETREHRVYHFAPTGRGSAQHDASEDDDILAPYIRYRGAFQHGITEYELETVYNLPDFDILGRKTVLALDLADRNLHADELASTSGSIVVWNPGQGHVPAYFLSGTPNLRPGRLKAASRDALQLAAAARNTPGIGTLSAPSIVSIVDSIEPQSVALFVVFPDPVPGVEWQREAADTARLLLSDGGILLASSTSTHIHRLLAALSGMVLHGSKKYHGDRAVLLKKNV